jgi:cyclopropane fatty-acyl-phospholipid synthase-like methyltransferase
MLAFAITFANVIHPMPPQRKHPVAAYYDANTRRFLSVGGSGRSVAIHRELWGPGVQTSEAAGAHINDLVAQAARAALARAPKQVRDLGCGVGGTLFHLAKVWPNTQMLGYTLSETQAHIGQTLANDRGLSQQCQIVVNDFTAIEQPEPAELAIAIESHTHIESLSLFLQAAKRHLLPGAILIVVDDMLARPIETLPGKEQDLVELFKQGWRLAHVPAVSELVAQASEVGLNVIEQQDLTGLLKLDRHRDHALRLVAPIVNLFGLGRLPLFANMIGGNALTRAYRKGIMRYMMVTLQAPEASEPLD